MIQNASAKNLEWLELSPEETYYKSIDETSQIVESKGYRLPTVDELRSAGINTKQFLMYHYASTPYGPTSVYIGEAENKLMNMDMLEMHQYQDFRSMNPMMWSAMGVHVKFNAIPRFN